MHPYTACPVQDATAPEPQQNGTSEESIISRPSCRRSPKPALSPPASLKAPMPASIRPFPLLQGWKETWRTPAAIVGLYFLALVCVLTHYYFFRYLNGRVISKTQVAAKTTTIPQAYATTVSLLLATSVRAALVACIGICYTQVMWAAFRRLMLKISLIEDLFQVQTNALRFVNHQLYIKTPLLAIIASFCWLIPIATIYPPGALVLGIQTVSLNTRFNVSVFHAKDLMNTANQSTIAEISCEYGEGPPVSPIRMFGPPKFPEAALNPSFLKSCQFVPGITDTRIRYITNTNLIVGELPRLNPPSGQNSSYSLEFWGTTLDCATKDRILERPVVASNSSATWNVSEPVTEGLSSPTREVSLTQNATFTYRKLGNVDTYQYYPCSGDPIEEPALGDSKSSVLLSDIRVLVPVIETTCHPKLVKYIVAISHGGGVQNITYTIKDGEPAPDYTSEFKDFHGTFEQFVQFSDAITFYLDFASNLNNSPTYTPDITFKSPQGHQKTQSRTLDNRTVVQTCSLQTSISIGKPQLYDQFSIWPLSVFERRLPSDPSHPNAFASKFDPKLATDLLINTTISALTLNDRFDIVNGTESHSFNVYRFEHQLTFFLPYCLALGLAIPTIALGLVALYVHNHGVSAINGGFLQLLMTTTGRTEMEAIIMRGSGTLGGEENVSKELQEMEVRFGELKYNDKTECSSMATSPSLLAYSNSAQEAEELQSEPNQVVNTQDVQYLGEAQQAFYSSVYSNCKSKVRRVGFGTAQDILPTTKA